MDWMFGGKSVVLVIQPDESGKKYAGFREGKSLSLTAKSGETVQIVMDRFNTYRGPDSQVNKLWFSDGRPLPFSHVLTENTTALLRG